MMGTSDMDSFYVDPDWLGAVRGGLFYYPASGGDLKEPIKCFSGHLNAFHFCDIGYLELDRLRTPLKTPPTQISYSGPLKASLERRFGYRHIEPGKRVETYQRQGEEPLIVVRRRGFGQMGLAEFPERSISVFMHRGDSQGEGGSNIWFFSDRDSRYPPLARLFSTLQSRLLDRALVVTDGSNTSKAFLKRFNFGSGVSGEQAYLAHRGQTYIHGRLSWESVGWLSDRYGPTIVWGVTKILGAASAPPPSVMGSDDDPAPA